MKYIWIIIGCFISLNLTAQSENHTWYFSETSKGLFFDFNTNAVSVTNVHSPLSYEGCGVAADPATGDVLFYTNGIKLVDANHLQMPNGGGLLGNITCASNGTLCPVPGTTDKYYVFYNSASSPNAGTIYYSVVDMSLQGNGTISLPLGDVVSTQKNIQVITNAEEGFAIIPNPNGSFWMVSPQNNSNIIRILNVTSSGITQIGTFTAPDMISDAREVRFCNSNNKIAIANMIENEGCFIMDFNVSSGVISNCNLIQGSILGTAVNNWTGFFDCEWSPDGTKLYLSKYRTSSSSGELYQYNLNLPSNPISLIYTLEGGYNNAALGLKLAPDGKIYFLYVNNIYSDSRYVGVINSPNIAGVGCDFLSNVLDIGTSSSPVTHKFPEFLLPKTCINVSVNDITICAGQSATLTASGATTYVWDNGLDTSHQQVVSPTTTTSYIVTGTTGTCVTSDTATVTVNQSPTPVISGSLSYCSGASVTLDAGAGYTGYIWSTGASSQIISATIANNPITVNVFDTNGCMGTSGPVSLTENSSPAIHGTVEYSDGFIGVGDATVRLFEFGTNGNHNLIDSVSVGLNGSFLLQNFPEGLYYVHVKLDNNSGYQHVHNTYYDSTFQWLDATLFNMQCGMDTSIAIHMFETGPTLLGNGHMNGTVTLFSGNKAAGMPVAGAEVLIMQESNNMPLKSVYTDNEGNYSFTGIPEDSYTMYIDIPGLPMVQTYSGIIVTATDTLFENLNFYIDTTDVTAGIYTIDLNAVTLITTPDFSIELYPNPVKTEFNMEYTLVKRSNINIEIVDISGKSTVVENAERSEGKHKNNFNTEKLGLSPGIYLLKFTIDNNVYMKKMVIQ